MWRGHHQTETPRADADLGPVLGDLLEHRPEQLDELLVGARHDRIPADSDRDSSPHRFRTANRPGDDEIVNGAQAACLEGDLIDQYRVAEQVKWRTDQ
jgi:hypothetical protein